MDEKMAHALNRYVRKQESATHVTTMLSHALRRDMAAENLDEFTARYVKVPNHYHVTALMVLFLDLIKECHVDPAYVLKSLIELNREACEEVLKCTGIATPVDSLIWSLLNPASASATDREPNSQNPSD